MRRVVGLLALMVLVALVPAGRAVAAGPTAEPYLLNPRLLQVEQVDGTIIDVSATAVLYLDLANPPVLNIRNRVANAVTAVPVPAGTRHAYGWLTPAGAIFSTYAADGSYPSRLFEWSVGAGVVDLGEVASATGPSVVGSKVLWRVGDSSLYRRDLATEVTDLVTQSAWGEGSLGPGGDVVYATANGVNRYHDGTTEEISVSGPDPVGDPITDDVNIAYARFQYPNRYSRNQSIWLYAGKSHLRLAEPTDLSVYFSERRFDVAGGWTAFKGTTDRRTEIYVRSPSGEISQVSDLSGDQQYAHIQIVGLSPTGETLYAVNDALYLGMAGRAPVPMAYGLGDWTSQRDNRPLNIGAQVNGRWLLAIAGTLYEYSDRPLISVTVTTHGHGTVGIAPYGAVCRATCEYAFVRGAVVVASAAADLPGWQFTTLDGCVSLGRPDCRITVDSPVSLAAYFVESDTTAPTTSSPTASMVAGSPIPVRFPPAVPLRASWTSTDVDNGLSSTELQMAANGGEFLPVPLETPAAQTGLFTAVSGVRYQLRARASDDYFLPNVGAWSLGVPVKVETTSLLGADLDGNWHQQWSASAWLGDYAWTIAPAAAMTFQTSGKEVGVVARTDLNMGTIEVYVDGQLRQTVPTAYAGGSALRLVASVALGGGTHTVRIVRGGQTPGPIEVHGAVILADG